MFGEAVAGGMKILLTGGTGYIGSAVLDRLVEAGHDVTGVVRSQKASLAVQDAGATGVIGDLFDATWLASELRQHDGAIHTAAGSDENDSALNDAVIAAVTEAYSGTDKPFVHTGGIWTYGNDASITETSPSDPPPLTSWRPASEKGALDSGVKVSVIQPGVVYGRGKGIPAMLGVDDGAVQLFGSGDQHWVTVHVDDLADLYLRVLEDAPGGKTYVAASGHNPTVRELGEALGAIVTPEPEEATIGRLGAFGEALLLDQRDWRTRQVRSRLGTHRPSLVDQLAKGYGDGE